MTVKSMSSSERKNLADNYLARLSLVAKRLCPEARIEATTEVFEDEDGHVRVYPPAGLREKEIAEIEGKLADRCVDILVKRESLFAQQFMTDRTALSCLQPQRTAKNKT